jgi:protein required for attachment to host cells
MRAQAKISREKTVTWVLVADGRRAQVYERKILEKRIPIGGSEGQTHYKESLLHELLPVDGMAWEAESQEIYETGRNATGMVFESASSARSMSEPHVDVRKKIKSHLVEDIARKLNEATAKKEFTDIVLVAPDRILGELKKHLNADAKKAIVAELPKDFTHYKGDDLVKHLGDIV